MESHPRRMTRVIQPGLRPLPCGSESPSAQESTFPARWSEMTASASPCIAGIIPCPLPHEPQHGFKSAPICVASLRGVAECQTVSAV